VPVIGRDAFDAKFDSFRAALNPNIPLQMGGLPYLWVGMHRGVAPDTRWYPHCAVVVFYEHNVHLISPNSIGSDGKMLEEDLEYKEFILHTFVLFDIVVKAPTALPARKLSF